MVSIAFRGTSGALALSALMALSGCGVFGAKKDPNAPNPKNTYQEETARMHARQPTVDPRIDVSQIARSNLELAAQYYAYGRYTTADEVIERSLAANPANAKAWSLAASISVELNDIEKARQQFAKSLALGPNDPDVLHNYGTFLCQTGKNEEGLPYFLKALSIPTYQRPATSETGAGACLLQMGRDDEAQARFDAALESEPMNARAILGSLQLAIKRQNALRAKDMLNRYQQVAPVTAQSLWLAVQVARLTGNRADERMAAQDLRNNFQGSPEVKMLDALPKL